MTHDSYRTTVKLAMAKYAMEFDTDDAMKAYFELHPKADKAKHWVKKTQEKSTKKQTPKRKSKPLKNPKTTSRVGIPGDKVLPPPKLPRLTGLKPDEAEEERRMNEAVENDPQGMADAFYDVAKENNWVFETDAAKGLMPEWSRPDLPPDERGKPCNPERAKYRSKYNTVLHQGSNAIAKRAFLRRLDEIAELPDDNKRRILITSGGVAAGKGTVLDTQPKLKEEASATWDAAGEQNATENEWVMQECIARGIRPTFLFVHSDPRKKWPGVINRAKGQGRMVDARLFADSYAIGAKNFEAFREKYEGQANFVYGLGSQDGTEVSTLDHMPPEALELDADELYDYASAWTDDNKDSIPEHIYEGATIGRRVFEEA